MKTAICFVLVFLMAKAQNLGRLGRIYDFGFDEDLEPKINILRSNQVLDAKERIQREIEQINAKLTQDEKNILIENANKEDPEGYTCQNEVMEIKEISFVDQVHCYNTTEEVCSEPKTEKKCETHFKKECWIDYKEESSSKTVRICSTKPERKCNLSEEEKAEFGKTECNIYYETVCQTEYINKNVTEDQTECKTVDEEMCEDGICVQVPKRECETFQIESLKAIPSTTCDQKKQEICVTPSCPLVVTNQVCEDVEKTFVNLVPTETCEIHPREVCVDVLKQYPSLKIVKNCDVLPRETCNPERVLPKEVTRPVIKKVCTENSLPDEETYVWNNNEIGQIKTGRKLATLKNFEEFQITFRLSLNSFSENDTSYNVFEGVNGDNQQKLSSINLLSDYDYGIQIEFCFFFINVTGTSRSGFVPDVVDDEKACKRYPYQNDVEYELGSYKTDTDGYITYISASGSLLTLLSNPQESQETEFEIENLDFYGSGYDQDSFGTIGKVPYLKLTNRPEKRQFEQDFRRINEPKTVLKIVNSRDETPIEGVVLNDLSTGSSGITVSLNAVSDENGEIELGQFPPGQDLSGKLEANRYLDKFFSEKVTDDNLILVKMSQKRRAAKVGLFSDFFSS